MITIRLSWPHAELFKNANAHHMVYARERKRQKLAAWSLAYEAGIRKLNAGTLRTLTFTFHPRTGPGRKPDLDNTVFAIKGAIDGLALALGVDDGKLAMRFPERLGEPVKGGAIVVEVTA
jgi:hypothetical protein